MENIIISCESTSDLPKELAQQYNIDIIDMDFLIDGEVYNTSEHGVSSTDLYNKMKRGSKTSTSQINTQLYEEYFEKLLKKGDVIHIAFSSGLSDTYKSAVTASKAVNAKSDSAKVYVIDSLCACSGHGMLAILARKYSKEAKDIHTLVNYVEKTKMKLNHIFTVDNLKYLANGGRVKASTALIGNILNIKPVMRMDEEGHLVVVNKVMSRKKALLALINKVKATKVPEENMLFISHANCLEDATHVSEALSQDLNIQPIITDLGPVIGSHSGPGTIAIFYLGKSR